MTPLDKTLKRSLTIKGADYVVTLFPDAIGAPKRAHEDNGDTLRGHCAIEQLGHPSFLRYRIQLDGCQRCCEDSPLARIPKSFKAK
jgi:hypothetical protein